MYWKNLSKKPAAYFQRKTGIKRGTFDAMVEVVKESITKRKTKRGNDPTYSIEDNLLIMLHYYREYPTFFHLGDIYDLHESTVQRIVRNYEDILIKSGKFSLPNHKELLELSDEDVVLIDVTETPIERPKKNKDNSTLVKRRNTH